MDRQLVIVLVQGVIGVAQALLVLGVGVMLRHAGTWKKELQGQVQEISANSVETVRHLTRINGSIAAVKVWQDQHEKRDDERFDTHGQVLAGELRGIFSKLDRMNERL